jgi:hypothetical protein
MLQIIWSMNRSPQLASSHEYRPELAVSPGRSSAMIVPHLPFRKKKKKMKASTVVGVDKIHGLSEKKNMNECQVQLWGFDKIHGLSM